MEPVYHYLTEGLIPQRVPSPHTSQKDQAFVLLPHLLSCLLCSVGPVGSLEKNRALTTTGFKGDFRSNRGSLGCGQRPLKSFSGAAP